MLEMLESLDSVDVLETLETIAAKIVGNGQLVLTAWLYGTLFLGFILALIVKRKSKGELQRVPYFVFAMMLTVVGMAVSYTWLWAIRAAANEMLWIIVAINLGSLLIIGYISGINAAARARDAFGTTAMGLVAMVPLLNFFLLFQPSLNNASPNRIDAVPVPKGGKGLLLGLALIVLYGALVGGQMMQMETTVEEAEKNPQSDNARNSIEFLIRSRGLEETLEIMAREGNKRLPAQVDQVTRMVTLSADGKRLERTYMVSLEEVNLPENFERNVQALICSYEPFKPLLREGATIEEVYKKDDGTLILRIPVTQEICDALEK